MAAPPPPPPTAPVAGGPAAEPEPFRFHISARCPHTRARCGCFHTPHGPVHTPRFMPVGTAATVKGVAIPQLAETGAEMVLAAALLLSGGLHMDGAMDTADGLAAGDRLLEAMEDSRVGASGAQALALLLLLRTAALAGLGPAAPAGLLAAAIWGRVAPLLAMARFPYLRPGGTAGFHRAHWAGLSAELRPSLGLLGLLLGGACSAVALQRPAAAPLLAALLAGPLPVLLVPWWLGRRLGGHSGDSYGACVEWTEALTLLLTAAGLAWVRELLALGATG